MKKEQVVLFYPTGIVHMRNLDLLKGHMPQYRFKVIVEPWMKEKAVDVFEQIPARDRLEVTGGRLSKDYLDGVDILFLSMAYPNPFRLCIVHQAAEKGIPVVSIEEVNQLALNDGIINHYFLPLDILGVPSQTEKDRFLELGLPGEGLRITGWPFFDQGSAGRASQDPNLRTQCDNPEAKRCCLLVLGSLKEKDMVSLESREVRREILHTVTEGLPGSYRLLIKPHPIETEEEIAEIKKLAPNAAILKPNEPIETVLNHVHTVVNRGNSQVILLAMRHNKPLALVPVGLKTIFHGTTFDVVSPTTSEFSRILWAYSRGRIMDYSGLIKQHFPLSPEDSAREVKKLFREALNKKTTLTPAKLAYIAVLYAFLGKKSKALKAAGELPEKETAERLKKLINRKIAPPEFKRLLEALPGKIAHWHLQALYVRHLLHCKKRKHLLKGISLLQGFDGSVNPHYFIDELVGRVELEFKAGNHGQAQALMEKHRADYSIFPYYKQAFAMLDFIYGHETNRPGMRKKLWLLMNLNTNYARRYLKELLKK